MYVDDTVVLVAYLGVGVSEEGGDERSRERLSSRVNSGRRGGDHLEFFLAIDPRQRSGVQQ